VTAHGGSAADAAPVPGSAIRRAQAADAARLAAFATRVYAESFAADTPPDDLALFLRETYSSALQEAEIRDERVSTFVAEEDETTLAGFFQVRATVPPPCVVEADVLELGRFYVAARWQGGGLAHRLMDAAVAEALRLGVSWLWLSTWEINARARAFYEKVDFRTVGTREFVVGTDVQIDRVMVRRIGEGAPALAAPSPGMRSTA